ncbi:DUF1672 family protein [Sporolactobacillus terrae]|uniref:DUF1672 family protein n=1 Tax=Sporolactobacillus terrae TaxID=269673 RepID=UPI0013E3CEA0|nr:DUF1672 family protein [Sporolactobacillus terrae]
MKTKKLVIPTLILSILLGGCSILENDHQGTSSTKKEQEKHYENNFISVQKYTGQGYWSENGERNNRIAEENRNQVIQAVKHFFQTNYKTEVKVHNLVGNENGITVFVESIGELHFYTYAVVPIKGNKILTDRVWTQKEDVDDAIRTGIYALVYDQQFKNLDNYIQKLVLKDPIIGLRQEAVEKVGGNGYSTPYYYVSMTRDTVSVDLNNLYLKHPKWSSDEWKKALTTAKIDPKLVSIAVQLYMKKPDEKPNKSIMNEIVSGIEKGKAFPQGSYNIVLHSNRINKATARGEEKNELERANPNQIIKY